jgi:hypothetical protein
MAERLLDVGDGIGGALERLDPVLQDVAANDFVDDGVAQVLLRLEVVEQAGRKRRQVAAPAGAAQWRLNEGLAKSARAPGRFLACGRPAAWFPSAP